MIQSEIVLGLPDFQITDIQQKKGMLKIWARYTGPRFCAHCGGVRLRNKGWVRRSVRHEDWGLRHGWLEIEVPKSQCLICGRYSRQPLPGIPRCLRASEAFQKAIYQQHLDGINRSRLARREGIGAATVERYFRRGLQRQFRQWHPPRCPLLLGIDEHFFTRRKGYATTFCDLRNHKVYDVVLGRSEAALEAYLARLEGKADVQMVCMDLAPVYRSLVRKHFPNARIVADRFHVIRLVNHHFLACWKQIDPVASRNRGLLSLMRRHRHHLSPLQRDKLTAYLLAHPALDVIYRFKQRLCSLLLKKHRNRKQCEALAPRFLRAIYQLRQAGLAQLVQLGETLHSWKEEIGTLWRFTRNNAITEGFHNKMELINRQAYGFRNFENYRLRVKVLCS
ncbi:MAG TPA: ISL3 family transposase [Bryobacteraceae bacterium]|nr:ISL3 family transposase [Bryobacteraceae bacterium]